MHNATAITTGSANQRPNTPCIRLWIDVTFRGLEDSYSVFKNSISDKLVHMQIINVMVHMICFKTSNEMNMNKL